MMMIISLAIGLGEEKLLGFSFTRLRRFSSVLFVCMYLGFGSAVFAFIALMVIDNTQNESYLIDLIWIELD